jgi:nucleotide-binding universal stress UspA family protein
VRASAREEKEVKHMNVLLPIDGSPYSEMAISMVKALQLPASTRVVLLGVLPEHIFFSGANFNSIMVHGDDYMVGHRDYQEQKEVKMLQGALKNLRAFGTRAESMVCWGSAGNEILKTARNLKAQLIIIGGKGERGAPKSALGDVAQKVIKDAQTSVILVKKNTPKIRNVLLATDGSEYSNVVAGFLLSLPLPAKTHVILTTAVQPRMAAVMKMPTMNLETNRNFLEQLQKAEEDKASELLAEVKNHFKSKGYKVSSMVLRGDPVEEIMMVASVVQPELIAIGAKGLTGIEALFPGSVSHKVANLANCSVLIGRTTSYKPLRSEIVKAH